MSPSRTISAHGAEITISEVGNGRRLLEVDPRDARGPRRLRCETTYPDALIDRFVSAGYGLWLADAVARDEDPYYVEHLIKETLSSFVSKDWLRGKRVLDFGCGSGASTSVLGRLLPESEIVGVELEPEYVELAKLRAAHHSLANVSFYASPTPESLPPDLGTFDVIYLSAVYEHLLPAERASLIPRIWSLLRPGGVLFIDETPWRWFPLEMHSTRLPINYFPDKLANWFARFATFSDNTGLDWKERLRRGIRGTSRHEIQRNVGPTGKFISPLRGDSVDLWWRAQDPTAYVGGKKLIYRVAKVIHALTGVVACPYLIVALRKDA